MSELYKAHKPGPLSQELGPVYKPATLAEIKDAHPKCVTCIHCHVFLREYTVESMPALQPITYAECFRGDPDEPTPDVDIHLDYCRHHEPREQNHD